MSYAPDTLQRAYDWRDDALCRLADDPGLWFPEHSNQISPARRWCDLCPVRQVCGEWAIAHPQQGIWGGMSEAQRDEIRRQRGWIKPQKPAECGTESGARRHRNRGEPICPPCADADLQAGRRRREQAKH